MSEERETGYEKHKGQMWLYSYRTRLAKWLTSDPSIIIVEDPAWDTPYWGRSTFLVVHGEAWRLMFYERLGTK